MRLKMPRFAALPIFLAILALPGHAGESGENGRHAEFKALAKEAFVYGYATVDSYNILYNYALNPSSPEYKAPLNKISHVRDVATPAERTIVAPNVDSPYSYAWLDLRTEPMVLSMPTFESSRYVSLQLIDAYTYIIGYVTPRTNGNVGGNFLVAGPGWNGAAPAGIRTVFRSPSELALAFYRTQLFDAADKPRVHALQDQYRVTPLSAFLGQPAPAAAPAPRPVPGLDVRKEPASPRFFAILNWMLQYMPTLPEDRALRERLARIGIEAGRDFVPAPADQAALDEGMRAGLADMVARIRRTRSSAELFGSRERLKDDPLTRAAAAMAGIYGNAEEEFLGIGYPADAEGKPFDGHERYRIRFAADRLPPVGAFWSITVYGADQFLYANPIGRHKIGSSMLADLKRDPDNGITLFVQHDSPGPEWQANWLPVPPGPFGLTFRTYLPGLPIRTGEWQAPPVVRQPN